MGDIERQRKVKLIASIIFRDEECLNYAQRELKRCYGRIEPLLEKVLPFDYTDYYENEFGKPLKRKLICFEKLIAKDGIYKIKLAANRIERGAKKHNKRQVNIDPGYVTEAKLVLLTTKNYTHRIYLAGGIFCEVTLFFQNNTFNPWKWTYPDYGSKELISYFNKVREVYMQNIK
ncbi:MAG: DUF4416 family protein [Candidatus Omnitrophota bacterium]